MLSPEETQQIINAIAVTRNEVCMLLFALLLATLFGSCK